MNNYYTVGDTIKYTKSKEGVDYSLYCLVLKSFWRKHTEVQREVKATRMILLERKYKLPPFIREKPMVKSLYQKKKGNF